MHHFRRRGTGRRPESAHPSLQEIFITLEGEATIVANDQKLCAGPGDIIIVPPHTPHGFTNTGSAPLRQIDIHVSPTSARSGCERFARRLKAGSSLLRWLDGPPLIAASLPDWGCDGREEDGCDPGSGERPAGAEAGHDRPADRGAERGCDDERSASRRDTLGRFAVVVIDWNSAYVRGTKGP